MQSRLLTLPNGETTRIADSGGGGPTVVLVHGLANAIEIWEPVFPRLSERFRLVAFDFPGFGQASRPDAPYDAAFFADQLQAVLDGLGIDRAHLVGNSLGASTILHFSKTGLSRIGLAVLAAPGGFGRRTNLLMRSPAIPVVGGWISRPTPLNMELTIRLALHDQAKATPELLAFTKAYARIPGSDRSFARSLQSGVGLLGSRSVRDITVLAKAFHRRTLVLWGRQDRVFPAEQRQRALELLPEAEGLVFDDCGHYPQWEQPELFADAVERFLT